MARSLMKGNEAMATAAIAAGCKCFFGYPITPQNEIPEFMSKAMYESGGAFVQAESELAAINMVYGAGGAGVRAMTSSSSPGIALKQEGVSYLAGSEIPAVILNVMRGGPGLGGIQPSQSDYNMMTRGGGDGDYNCPVLAPANLQEAADMIMEAFDIADYYRIPVYVAADGLIGQMMEPVEIIYKPKYELKEKTWATNGTRGKREKNIINSLYLDPELLYEHNVHLQEKYNEIKEKEARAEKYQTEDADIILVSYGTMSRVVRGVVDTFRAGGKKVGMIRPQTLWPFPVKAFNNPHCKMYVSIEMSMGQMVDDVKLAIECKVPVKFLGKAGGLVPTSYEIMDNVIDFAGGIL
ncbi:3-methyl-2-oxobutanoate dehydrogenase subunit VorB [Brachyspira pilosicoli]|uniref:3-methyl-2-oxobutanoate dehydrogenase subunit VorB n=1 Tax=Brachyspira pilosicoli TaxID=52584 RepID=A0A5C8EWY0_BRAPL|nr:3-methyl-2-oxobutanoate dehydrogenase subunit VorB [Brachyspira pilosicoli]TXJ40730.1 3-methyl-2-oxobutanoate dehydrogenase subunit VorB [Brachyspira pilosicoli]